MVLGWLFVKTHTRKELVVLALFLLNLRLKMRFYLSVPSHERALEIQLVLNFIKN